MIVTNLIKGKANKYIIKFDNGKDISLWEDTLAKYSIYRNKEVTINEYSDILRYDSLMSEYTKVLDKTEKKMYSKEELVIYLKKRKLSIEDINMLIEKLERNKIINDENYTNCYVSDKLRLTKQGPTKIKYNLIRKGIDESVIRSTISEVDSELLINKINKIIDLKFKQNKKYSNKMLKQKIVDNLLKEGYEKDMFIDLIKIPDDFELKIIAKEFARISSKKKSNDEVKQELLKKGFKIDSINTVM